MSVPTHFTINLYSYSRFIGGDLFDVMAMYGDGVVTYRPGIHHNLLGFPYISSLLATDVTLTR